MMHDGLDRNSSREFDVTGYRHTETERDLRSCQERVREMILEIDARDELISQLRAWVVELEAQSIYALSRSTQPMSQLI